MSSYCSPNAFSCYEALSKDTHGCRVSCTGIYADVEFAKNMHSKDSEKKVSLLQERYNDYKNRYARNIKFDSNDHNLSMLKCIYKLSRQLILTISDTTIKYNQLQLYQIYFDTATFDVIERDVKMTLTGQLGLIGGTMGLLTGFSILSAVEICYFAGKFFMSRRIWREERRKF